MFPLASRRPNVSVKADNDALVEATREFGGVELMVLSAGITLRADGVDVSESDYRRLMAINLDGPLFGAQVAARQMKALGKAVSIVLMASMGGLVLSNGGFRSSHRGQPAQRLSRHEI